MNDKITNLTELRETLNGYRKSRVIQSAVNLRIFDCTDQARTATEVARETRVSLRGAEIILDALAAIGLLEKEGQTYRNTTLTADHLTWQSPEKTVWAVDHAERLFRRWALLPEAIKEGEIPAPAQEDFCAETGHTRTFMRSMYAHSREKAEAICGALDLSGCKKVMDVGGGPGTYFIALAKYIPDLEGLLVDLEGPLQQAAEFLGEAGLTDRVKTLATDILVGEEAFGEDYDLVILSNVLHIYGPEDNCRILRRIHRSLRPGGKLVIHEFFLDDGGISPQLSTLFSVNMLVATKDGRSYRRSTVEKWLAETGFHAPELLALEMDSQALVVKKN